MDQNKSLRRVDMIIIHCSDTPEDIPGLDEHHEMDIGVAEIEQWHKARAATGEPWSHFTDVNGVTRYIGYHFVVRKNGVVENGRPVNEVGCHTKGANKSSIGVCWVGRHFINDKQCQSLVQFVAHLCVDYSLIADDIYGHNHFSQIKTCPNFNSSMTYESIEDFRKDVQMTIQDIK